MNESFGIPTEREGEHSCPYPEQEPQRFIRNDIDHILKWASKISGVSDIVLQPGEPVVAVYQDETIRVTRKVITVDETAEILATIVSPDAPARLKGGEDAPFRYPLRLSRTETLQFRGQATSIQAPLSMDSCAELVFRSIPSVPPTVDDIGLQAEIVKACLPKSGLVLVTGPTGSGKSTTLAAMLRLGLETPPGRRTITYEQPIEFDLQAIPNRIGTVAQSAVGDHVRSFAHGVKIALRRKPARILFGEIRDKETIHGSFVASQTGHAVYGTLHTDSVATAIPRMVNEFPEEARWAMARNLIESSRLIIHQRLVKNNKGSLMALREWLVLDEEKRHRILAAGEFGYVQEMTRLMAEGNTRLIDDVKSKYDDGLMGADEYQEYEDQYAADLRALAAEVQQKGSASSGEVAYA